MRISRLTSIFALSLAVLAVLAGPAAAGWGPVQALAPQGAFPAPVIAFSQTGAAALAFDTTAHQDTYLLSHAVGGGFSTPQVVASGFGVDQVVMAADGATALRSGPTMLVEPSGSTSFGPPQQLGGPQQVDGLVPDALVVPTSRGEVIASVRDNQQNQAVDVLAPGSSSFTPPLTGLQDFYPVGAPSPVAADDAGGVFLTDQTSVTRCKNASEMNIIVAYRPAGGSFTTATALRCQVLSLTSPPSVIAAAGSGRAVLVTGTGVSRHYRLLVQTLTGSRIGPAHVLARTTHPLSLFGPPAIGLGGRVTIASSICRRLDSGCTVSAASGSLHGGTWHTRTFGYPGVQVGDGFLMLTRCSGSCTLALSYAGRHGFGAPQQLAANGQFAMVDPLTAATGGRRRVRLVVWSTASGQLFAATMNSKTGRFGSPTELASSGVANTSNVNYEVGPAGQAIVAWVTSTGAAYAVAYSGG